MSVDVGLGAVAGNLVHFDGRDYYRIDGVERMEPFLMTVVSDSDLWLFVSSAGTLTGGRIDANHAFLPYETDDRLHRAAGITGPVTAIERTGESGPEFWRPFGAQGSARSTRSISKSVLGDRILFEEHNLDWELIYRAGWAPSRLYGWVRTVEIVDVSGFGAQITVVDGLLDVMPSGVDAATEQATSNLVDAYKRSEIGPWGTTALYTLESLISDRAEPAEALEATVIWSHGPLDQIDLDERCLAAMCDGELRDPVPLLTGKRGAYLMRGDLIVPPGESVEWMMVIDTPVDHSGVVERVRLAADPDAVSRVQADADAGSDRLRQLLALADAFQETGDPFADAHHLSNVLFNCMRGGVFPYVYRIPIGDFKDYLEVHNRPVFVRHAEAIADLGEWAELSQLLALGSGADDPDLGRLVLEYLPLTFSRRHGDPSRPWNRFSIQVEADDGSELLSYEGNWRDIFQNWEALLHSFPAFIPGVVAKFVNASTIDGHNPYRISREGVDWEVPDESDSWSNIGYWGDHQIVYLHRLLETWHKFDPGAMQTWFDQPIFSYADVPYVLADHGAMVSDPRRTVSFDHERNEAIKERISRIGSDGRLVVTDTGDIRRVGLLEKLLVPALGKLTAYVPGGGIWMNTQRPEWNDANNALAGHGLSMVTVYHLHAYLRFLRDHVDEVAEVQLSASVGQWLSEITDVFGQFESQAAGGMMSSVDRRRLIDALGNVGTRHRVKGRWPADATTATVTGDSLRRFCAVALRHLDSSIREARRADGLYQSYNILSFPSQREAEVNELGIMLEGQVAVLSSGVLDASDSLEVLGALFSSDLHRPDQDSFLLYPPRLLPTFLDRNTVTSEDVAQNPILADLVADTSHGLFTADVSGQFHFRPDLINAGVLEAALDDLSLDDDQRAVALDVYEQVFQHHSFTGRSGAMYGYEGIGSIYWHMVSKLLLAIQEAFWSARSLGESAELVDGLADAYSKVRNGLGFRKSPEQFGAMPLDCYSHTPAHAGAQQPGMTGQVKEQVLTRFGELGVQVVDGCLLLDPVLLSADELFAVDGFATFTFCRTPLELRMGDEAEVEVYRRSGEVSVRPGKALTRAESHEIFWGTGSISKVVVIVPAPTGLRTTIEN